jgi:hypothetical protein
MKYSFLLWLLISVHLATISKFWLVTDLLSLENPLQCRSLSASRRKNYLNIIFCTDNMHEAHNFRAPGFVVTLVHLI